MTSLGVSPTFNSSYLAPTHYGSPDLTPRGGILLNPLDAEGASIPPSPALAALSINPSLPVPSRASEPPDSPITPVSPIVSDGAPMLSPSSANQRIRFAPLPDPRRPRSLSTGQNVHLVPSEGEDGEVKRTIEIRGVDRMDYDDEDVDDNADVSDYDENEDKKRRWSKTMTMGMTTVPGWRGTRKLLGMKKEEKDEAYMEGAPLKKSISTGGFTGSSPFRWNAETERKKSMQGLSSSIPKNDPNQHRRNLSLDPPLSTSLSSSPQPVRMLNGRVYGSRRASEVAEIQREYKERIEPKFVEWGFGKEGSGGMGSNSGADKGPLGDAEEGSGMEWVKRRREERQKREAERRAQESRQNGSGFGEPGEATLSSSQSSASNSPDTANNPATPHTVVTPLPTTPIIHISEHHSPAIPKHADPYPLASGNEPRLGTSAPGKVEGQEREHVTQAIQMPKGGMHDENRDVFDDDESESEEDRADENEEDDDGDFEEDEEDEPDIRTTSSAAGVEVVSRHKK